MRIEVELSGDDDATAELADRLHDWIEALWPQARVRVDYGFKRDAVIFLSPTDGRGAILRRIAVERETATGGA